MRAFPAAHIRAPRRLRARLVLGFGLTVAVVLAALTLGERLILARSMTDTLAQSLVVAARVGTLNPPGLVSTFTVGAPTLRAPGMRPGSTPVGTLTVQGMAGALRAPGGNPGVTSGGVVSIAISGAVAPPASPAGTSHDPPGSARHGASQGRVSPSGAGAPPPGLDQMALANLRQIAQALAGPDQPVAMLDGQGHLLISQISLSGAGLRPRSLVGAVLADLLAAARPRLRALHGPWHATVSTADGTFLLVLWPSQLQVTEQVGRHGVRVLMLSSGSGAIVGFPAFTGRVSSSPVVVLLAANLAATQRTLDTVTAISLGGALLALSLTVILGLLVVNAALRPLATIAGAAEQLARGDYAYRLALGASTDEVGRLAIAFNRMAEAIGVAFATQRRFLADASHELRTPLTALRGYADVILLKLRGDPDMAERMVRAMQEDAVRMSRLVNDLLTLARLDGGLDLQCAPLILQELVSAAATEAEAIAGGVHEITLDLAYADIVLWGDRDRLRQVLSNVVGNACTYSPPGSRIVLRLRHRPGWAQVVVQDDGPGIAPDDLARLGQRFFRGDAARSRQSGGTGLGVAIARGLVAAHGGTLIIQSAVGVGTTVTITLPTCR